MPNGVGKKDEFDAATRVMESDLLRVLTDESSDVGDNSDTDRAREVAPQIGVIVEESAEESVTTANQPHGASTAATAQPEVAPQPPARVSRVVIVAGIVAAVVLAFDASLFALHRSRTMRAAASATTQPAVAPAPASSAVVARAIPDAPPTAVHAHRHSHHRHARH